MIISDRDLPAEAVHILGSILSDARNNGLPSADLMRIVSELFSSVVVAELAVGISAASLARNSIGSNTKWVVPSRYGVLS